MIQRTIKLGLFVMFTMLLGHLSAQNTNQVKVDQLIEKKAEYHKLTNGEVDGYRIKIHFGVDKEAAQNVRTKFSAKFTDIGTNVEYQQPNFVVLVGDYKTKLEAFEALKKIQVEFSNAFIVKGKIRAKI
ncbi:MAG: SPOR domain-containing protein [Bacteroidia bacterium]|jgi:tRNA/tmRNA/rRNA uracil-C5-methylase (TrmA/RlmC/RlmD family)|nr:SPOR domain-containing protein [Bacteroidia bacterium]